ncbi:unnamed protein product, partial [Chrysoparadoxa australica]
GEVAALRVQNIHLLRQTREQQDQRDQDRIARGDVATRSAEGAIVQHDATVMAARNELQAHGSDQARREISKLESLLGERNTQ